MEILNFFIERYLYLKQKNAVTTEDIITNELYAFSSETREFSHQNQDIDRFRDILFYPEEFKLLCDRFPEIVDFPIIDIEGDNKGKEDKWGPHIPTKVTTLSILQKSSLGLIYYNTSSYKVYEDIRDCLEKTSLHHNIPYTEVAKITSNIRGVKELTSKLPDSDDEDYIPVEEESLLVYGEMSDVDSISDISEGELEYENGDAIGDEDDLDGNDDDYDNTEDDKARAFLEKESVQFEKSISKLNLGKTKYNRVISTRDYINNQKEVQEETMEKNPVQIIEEFSDEEILKFAMMYQRPSLLTYIYTKLALPVWYYPELGWYKSASIQEECYEKYKDKEITVFAEWNSELDDALLILERIRSKGVNPSLLYQLVLDGKIIPFDKTKGVTHFENESLKY